VQCLRSWRWAGRDAIVVGGASNEFNGAAVAVIDRANPSGTAPAVAAKFTCQGCPTGSPLAYVVLPGTAIERLQDSTASVAQMVSGDGGELTIIVSHLLVLSRLGRGSEALVGETNYVFTPGLSPVSAEHQPNFRVLHNEAHRRGVLDHPFQPSDAAALFPVLRWNGRSFEELRPMEGGPR
jgi:hypothetical protein